ncbi:MAG TPA: hypothetical protein VN778_05390 [Verrucomicrobiae bacterium]|nr:hypothetical protein [Verrucomicrobiae bacterium]
MSKAIYTIVDETFGPMPDDDPTTPVTPVLRLGGLLALMRRVRPDDNSQYDWINYVDEKGEPQRAQATGFVSVVQAQLRPKEDAQVTSFRVVALIGEQVLVHYQGNTFRFMNAADYELAQAVLGLHDELQGRNWQVPREAQK